MPFMGNPLKIKYSKYEYLNLKSLENEEQDYISFKYGNHRFHRYNKGLNIKINPPSCVLHFTSVADQVDEKLLTMLVSQVQKPLSVFKLKNNRSNMFLVKLKDQE